MSEPFLLDRFAARGLDVRVPAPAERAEVHRVIYDELCVGIVRDASRRTFRDIIGALVADGAEGMILGCTEIELLVGEADSPVPLFPTTRLHAEAAVTKAFRDARPAGAR
jgi:aspartate racemase